MAATALPRQTTVGTSAAQLFVSDGAGSALAISEFSCPHGVQLKLDAGATGQKVYLGGAGVTTGTGFALDPGQGFFLAPSTLATWGDAIWAIGSAAGLTVHAAPL